jgi:hypothetical protein
MAMIASMFSTATLNRHSASSSEAIFVVGWGESDAAAAPRGRWLRRRSRRSSRAQAPAEMRTQSTQKPLTRHHPYVRVQRPSVIRSVRSVPRLAPDRERSSADRAAFSKSRDRVVGAASYRLARFEPLCCA